MSKSMLMEKLFQLEGALEDLYRWFSDGFRHDQEACKVFGRLSMQKAKHVNLIQYQKRMLNGTAPASEPCDEDIAKVGLLLTKIDEFRSRIRQPRLSESIDISIELEGTSSDILHRSAMSDSNPDLAPFIAQLADGARHVAMLRSLASRYAKHAS